VVQKYAWAAHDKVTEEEPQLFFHLFYYNKIDFFRREEGGRGQGDNDAGIKINIK